MALEYDEIIGIEAEAMLRRYLKGGGTYVLPDIGLIATIYTKSREDVQTDLMSEYSVLRDKHFTKLEEEHEE